MEKDEPELKYLEQPPQRPLPEIRDFFTRIDEQNEQIIKGLDLIIQRLDALTPEGLREVSERIETTLATFNRTAEKTATSFKSIVQSFKTMIETVNLERINERIETVSTSLEKVTTAMSSVSERIEKIIPLIPTIYANVKEVPDNRTNVFSIKLDTARIVFTRVKTFAPYANSILIESTDAAFEWRVNSDSEGEQPREGEKGAGYTNFEVKSLYMKNSAAASGNVAKFVVTWKG